MSTAPASANRVVTLQVPGDKSLSHRAVMFSALRPGGVTQISGLLAGADVRSTLGALQAMGLRVVEATDDLQHLVLQAPAQLQEPGDVLDCGNSGTTMRLFSGLIPTLFADQPSATVTMTGDGSLRSRPMRRVVDPLRHLGVHWIGRVNNTRAPLTLLPETGSRRTFHPLRNFVMPVASAQVKSALLLAALSITDGEGLEMIEPLTSRDHTERMLQALGVTLAIEPLEGGARRLSLPPGQAAVLRDGAAQPLTWDIPGDFSSAAFHIVAALSLPPSVGTVRLTNVNLNPLRSGLMRALLRVGAQITIDTPHERCGEPCGDLLVTPTAMAGELTITADEVPSLVDELPILAVAAAYLDGTCRVTGAEELRAKESDRIESTVQGLRAVGVPIEGTPDGFVVQGSPDLRLHNPAIVLETHHDHRIAMALTVLNTVAQARQGAGEIGVWPLSDRDCAVVSYPPFYDHLAAIAPLNEH